MNRPTIVLAEDHPNVAEQLHKLLADSFDVVAVVSHGAALVKTALRVKPDVVITDISMPGMGRHQGRAGNPAAPAVGRGRVRDRA